MGGEEIRGIGEGSEWERRGGKRVRVKTEREG